jgi:mRNA-degrading endonuclease RelE of RelBE toxin-antitoxin system
LVGNKSGQWRYRIGDYRLLANIDDETITILVLVAIVEKYTNNNWTEKPKSVLSFRLFL